MKKPLPLSRNRIQGFTLIEMLIVVSMFGLIMGVIATLFAKGTQVYRHGETHIELQRTGRHISSRINPYVASMFSATNPQLDPVLVPNSVDPSFDTPNLRFITTEDWLGADYPSPVTSSLEALTSLDLNNYVYEIRLNEDRDLMLDRLDPNDPDSFAHLLNPTPTDSRVIVRAKNRGTDNPEIIENLRFTYVRRNLLMLRYSIVKNTRGAANQDMRIVEPFRITFNLPTKII